jgi:hypothetical protein
MYGKRGQRNGNVSETSGKKAGKWRVSLTKIYSEDMNVDK